MDACKALRAAGHKGFRAYAPLPEHELLEEGLALKHSPVRVFTLAGGLTGAATGFAFTSWTSMDWPLVTGGKPILSIPAYVVIAFECAILFGALSTVIGLFINAGLPNFRPMVAYHPECSNGSFGVYVTVPPARAGEVKEILSRTSRPSCARNRRGSMCRRIRVRLPLVAALAAVASGACVPLDDFLGDVFGRSMRDQRSFDPYENPLLPPEGSVPFSAGNYAPGPYQVNVGQPEGSPDLPPPFTQEDMADRPETVDSLTNPVAPTPESLARGEQLYERVCIVCHGPDGTGSTSYIIEVYPAMQAYSLHRRHGARPQRRLHLRDDPGRPGPDAVVRTPDRALRPLAHRQLRAPAAGAPRSGDRGRGGRAGRRGGERRGHGGRAR